MKTVYYLPGYGGRVLLLSPIVGQFSNEATGASFVPPFPDRLRELATEGRFPAPARCSTRRWRPEQPCNARLDGATEQSNPPIP